MIAAKVLVGIDVSRDWLDGFLLPSGQRFRLPNLQEGHAHLIGILQNEPSALGVGFVATGGQEWALWKALVGAGVNAVQLPPAQIKAFARSHGIRAKTDRIDAKLIASFMVFRPETGRAFDRKATGSQDVDNAARATRWDAKAVGVTDKRKDETSNSSPCRQHG
ncbi:IS110 family transposase [Brucella tritici]|uniref:IS110 family transposase n=1 Tax=Brucella tritici TaxID=94626 RepID=UPI001AEDEC89|nr:transposase [Brucella tritici]